MVLVIAATYVSIRAQSPQKPAPFGSSLKRSTAETKGETREQTSQKAVEENLRPPEEIVRIDTSLVNLDVVVTDAAGSRYITGLTKNDFVLTEDNQPQTVVNLTVGDDASRLPRSLVLIFDRSQSQFGYLDASIEAAKTLVSQLTPFDEMAIVTDDVELAIGFTKDKKKLKKTLDSLKKLTITGYNTRSKQLSALLATVRELIDDKRRPIIIFQTDGDEAPRWENQRPAEYDLNTVYAEVEKSRAKLYTVIPGLRLIDVPEEEVYRRVEAMAERATLAHSKYKDMWLGMERLPPKPSPNSNTSINLAHVRASFLKLSADRLKKGQIAAARVADLTGGWTSFLETAEQANGIYERILTDINHRYIVSYYPTNKDFDGTLRKVRIEVRSHPEYVVQGRTSYYAIPR
jgi:VWFA-related protein